MCVFFFLFFFFFFLRRTALRSSKILFSVAVAEVVDGNDPLGLIGVVHGGEGVVVDRDIELVHEVVPDPRHVIGVGVEAPVGVGHGLELNCWSLVVGSYSFFFFFKCRIYDRTNSFVRAGIHM